MLPADGLAGVWGAGLEGQSVAKQLIRDGRNVLVVDENPMTRPPGLPAEADFRAGLTALEMLSACDFIVASPGIPRVHPFRQRLADLGIVVTTSTALWMADHSDMVVGVTGTKGKSTTAALTHFILKTTGIENELAGNIGVPLTNITEPNTVVVAELSSYQCAYLNKSPRIAVITNLYQDHLPWHGSPEQYWLDKTRVFTEGAQTLICSPVTLQKLSQLDVRLPVTVRTTDKNQFDVAAVPDFLRTAHGIENLKLAFLAAEAVISFNYADMLAELPRYVGLPHRLQTVSERDGRTWVDDSLSTTGESVCAAINSFVGRELVLIVGGMDRGIDYSPLTSALATRVPAVKLVCMPDNGRSMVSAYMAANPELVLEAKTMEDAVLAARDLSGRGAIIVMSPGAPSQNMYKNFEEKSNHFIDALAKMVRS